MERRPGLPTRCRDPKFTFLSAGLHGTQLVRRFCENKLTSGQPERRLLPPDFVRALPPCATGKAWSTSSSVCRRGPPGRPRQLRCAQVVQSPCSRAKLCFPPALEQRRAQKLSARPHAPFATSVAAARVPDRLLRRAGDGSRGCEGGWVVTRSPLAGSHQAREDTAARGFFLCPEKHSPITRTETQGREGARRPAVGSARRLPRATVRQGH